MSLVGLCLALVYSMFGLTSFVLCILPIFVMRFAQEPALLQKMRLDRIGALLGQELVSSQTTSYRTTTGSMRSGAVQSTVTTGTQLREVDEDRIERYLTFRDQVRAG